MEKALRAEKSVKEKSNSAEKFAKNSLDFFEKLIYRLLEVRPKELKQKKRDNRGN